MKKLLFLLSFLPLFSYGQIKVQSLPTTTVGVTGDFLIKDKAAGGAGGTQKISIADFLRTYSITAASTSTVTAGSGIDVLGSVSTYTINNTLTTGIAGNQTILGGTFPSNGLTYKGTSAIGTTTVSAHTFVGGNNGATTILKMLNNGSVQYPTGTPGVGKVIADDGTGTGIMAWTTAPTGSLTATFIPYAITSSTLESSHLFQQGENISIMNGKNITGEDSALVNITIGNSGNYIDITTDGGAAATSFITMDTTLVYMMGGRDKSHLYVSSPQASLDYRNFGFFSSDSVSPGTSGGVVVLGPGTIITRSQASPQTGVVFINAEDDTTNGGLTNVVMFGKGRRGTANNTAYFTNVDIKGNLIYKDGSEANGSVLTYTNGASVWAASSAGGITSIEGTANEITVSGTTTPTLSIASTYDGGASIATTGTVTAGEWRATPVGATYGGTGISTYTIGDLITANSSTSLTRIASGAAGSFLRSIGTASLSSFSTLILPNAATTSQIIYASTTNTWGSSSTFVTDGNKMSIGAAISGGYNGNYGLYTCRTSSAGRVLMFAGESALTTGGGAIVIRGSGSSAPAHTQTSYNIHGASYSGNYTGTSIAIAATGAIINSATGYADNSTGNFIISSGGLYVLNGTTATNIGISASASGLLIGEIQGLHTNASTPLHIIKTTEQQRTGYDASNYESKTVGSTGGVTYNAVGSGSAFAFSDPTSVAGIFSVRNSLGSTFLAWQDAGASNAYRVAMNLATSTADFQMFRATGSAGSESFTETWRVSNALGNLSNTTTAGTAYIHLKAGTATASTAPLKFTSGTNLTTAEAGAFEYDGTNLYFSPSTVRYRLTGIGTPTVVAGGGAGTGPTVSVTGNDGSHQVSITTGTSPAGTSSTIGTVTFAKAFGSSPKIVFSPANPAAALLSGATGIYMDSAASSSTYVISSGTNGLQDATIYLWNVVVQQ